DVIGDVPTYLVSDEVMRGIAGFQVHRGALAAVERPELPSVAGLLTGPGSGEGPPGRILILEDLVDHGNVGAIFRCAAALGVDAVVLSPRCADPLYRRSIKVSMGAVFAIPYARMTDWYHGLALLREAGFRTLALTPDQSVTPIDKVALGDRVALLLGSEGDGLSSRWLSEADERVCIPMSAQAMRMGVDSLNVVAAAAIACPGLVRDACRQPVRRCPGGRGQVRARSSSRVTERRRFAAVASPRTVPKRNRPSCSAANDRQYPAERVKPVFSPKAPG